MKRIVLASASPRRQELLRQIGMHFDVVPSDEEENIIKGLTVEETVLQLAEKKAKNVAGRIKENALVIGADTVVFLDGILGKPEKRETAFEMLKKLQGRQHDVLTGICIIDTETQKSIVDYEKTTVKMATISDEEIEEYINSGEPLDKAGAYAIQGRGGIFIEEIHGCYYNVVGLPLALLKRMMLEFGQRI